MESTFAKSAQHGEPVIRQKQSDDGNEPHFRPWKSVQWPSTRRDGQRFLRLQRLANNFPKPAIRKRNSDTVLPRTAPRKTDFSASKAFIFSKAVPATLWRKEIVALILHEFVKPMEKRQRKQHLGCVGKIVGKFPRKTRKLIDINNIYMECGWGRISELSGLGRKSLLTGILLGKSANLTELQLLAPFLINKTGT